MLFRKAILLIHGFAGGPWDHQNLANDLQLYPDFDVYSFILPGHDKAIISKVKKEDWIKEAEIQTEKLIQKGYKKIYVIGHSMGGVIATHIAAKYKEVKKLVLVAPAFKYLKFKGEKFDIINSIKSVPEVIKANSDKQLIGRMFKVPLSTILEFMHLVKEHTKDVKKIYIPTLIIHGDADTIVPKDSVLYVHNNINSKVNILVNIKDVGHKVFSDVRSAEAEKITTEFLRKNNYPKTKSIINI